MIETHWSSSKTLKLHRSANNIVGISLIVGKINITTPSGAKLTTVGVFIKSIGLANAKEIAYQVGDRVLKIGDTEIQDANKDAVIKAFQNTNEPILITVQSLLLLNQKPEESVIPSVEKRPEDVKVVEDKSKTVPTKEDIDDKKVIVNGIDVEQSIEEFSPRPTSSREIYISPDDLEVEEEEEKDDTLDEDDEEEDDEEDEQDEDDDDYREIDYSCKPALPQLYTTWVISDEIQKKYAKFGKTVMMVQLERGQKGLGLSLAGHKDRNCMAVFVCGLNPNGEAYKMGGIEVGDEILEVNGIVLHGRCHLNASAIIKGLAGPIFKIVILRRKAAINDIAVRPLTQFPVTLEEEEVNEERFAGYPNVRNVIVEKGNHSLGIMIIEGKHSEMGQGIFISDILDDSVADKAGLEVGEMILAVNKDVLLGANYETAANILKRTEGVVTLVLSNPIKKLLSNDLDYSKNTAIKPSTTPRAATPRAVTPIPDLGRPPSSLGDLTPAEPIDPTTCSIIPGKETTIEVKTNNQSLGLFLVGGKDTLISDKIIVLEIFPGGAADKDGRIQAGDQILEVNGTCLKDATNEVALQTLRQILPKIKLVVLRSKSAEYITVEADLARKPGKGLGLSIIGKACGKGAYVSEILNGGTADIDGRIAKGDLLISINGQDVENLSAEEIGAILKTITGRTVLKLRRYKPV
ncbi:hypothetical protein RN001_000613 [Aquatica leii]|uniref:PDZ domain-containing protein n=1 Tax=Aquatica leii TaxID=1421715 RepID=A0AAN7SJ78_9COLE|nr:hypothetical protein RN001_000613 [Aquatica leii]